MYSVEFPISVHQAMDSNKQRESQGPQEAAIMDPWATSTIDPHDLLTSFVPFETEPPGKISGIDLYRSITPDDTPESSRDGLSEPNSDLSESVALDINTDIFDDDWLHFGGTNDLI
jgi:hypothetical protein